MEVPMEMQQRYIERRQNDLLLCQGSLDELNFEELKKVGHQLKGNGVTFGFRDLSLIGGRMENAANDEDIEELENAVKAFSLWLQRHRYLN